LKKGAAMNKKISAALCISVLALSACSGAKETLGLTKTAPDEFEVVKQAPLSMPPDYNLRPPRPGAPRPQEQTTSAQAREVVFGVEARDDRGAPTDAESLLLQQAGGLNADPDIRAKVDAETNAAAKDNRPVAKKLLGLVGAGDEAPPATVVDAGAEAERLRQNQEQGKPVTEGETPSVEE
jgi:hypothetical protein